MSRLALVDIRGSKTPTPPRPVRAPGCWPSVLPGGRRIDEEGAASRFVVPRGFFVVHVLYALVTNAWL